MFEEDLRVFFNPNEFGVCALIRGKAIEGLLSAAYETFSYDTQTHHILWCSAKQSDFVRISDCAVIHDQHYHIIGIEKDGTGLAKLTLVALEQNHAH